MHYYYVILLFRYSFYFKFFLSESEIELCYFVKGREKDQIQILFLTLTFLSWIRIPYRSAGYLY